MGVDPQLGLACLGKVNMVYEDDRDLMIQFYGFVAKEEIACEEAELGPERFAERIEMLSHLEAHQLEMLKHMHNLQLDDQSAILEKIRQQMENAGFQPEASLLAAEQIQNIVGRRVTPVFQPM
ncbi:plant/protein [Perilla frutescens var. hirtella]|nr:plant/protein [Perilla frutescens var. hirtella]